VLTNRHGATKFRAAGAKQISETLRMNRKQRRAALKQRPSAGAMRAGPAADTAGQLFAEALRCQQQHRLEDAARAFIAERGYTPSVADIRRCRQDRLTTPLRSLSRFNDFYTPSECCDLLFYVQESRMTLPAVKAFIDVQRLKFIGFDFSEIAARNFRALFAKPSRPTTDLDYWHGIETQYPRYPDTFASMYHFWVQKPAA
jgi:hypothetical protein